MFAFAREGSPLSTPPLDGGADREVVRFQFVSDVHAECYNHPLPAIPRIAPILVLAGDIGRPTSSTYRAFLAANAALYDHVIVIAGNHEYYQGQKPAALCEDIPGVIRAVTSALPNVHFLDRSSVDIGGVRFLGTTLWTRLDEGDARNNAQMYMSDYGSIYAAAAASADDGAPQRRRKVVNIRAEHTDAWHHEQSAWLRQAIAESPLPTVVVTHHCPHPDLLRKKQREDATFAHAYYTALPPADFFRRPVVCWVSGHAHNAMSFYIPPPLPHPATEAEAGVLCVSNCRGYPSESVQGYDTRRTVSVMQRRGVANANS